MPACALPDALTATCFLPLLCCPPSEQVDEMETTKLPLMVYPEENTVPRADDAVRVRRLTAPDQHTLLEEV